jgi:ribosomal protein S4
MNSPNNQGPKPAMMIKSHPLGLLQMLARKLKNSLAEDWGSYRFAVNVKRIQSCFREQFMQVCEERLDAFLMAAIME